MATGIEDIKNALDKALDKIHIAEGHVAAADKSLRGISHTMAGRGLSEVAAGCTNLARDYATDTGQRLTQAANEVEALKGLLQQASAAKNLRAAMTVYEQVATLASSVAGDLAGVQDFLGRLLDATRYVLDGADPAGVASPTALGQQAACDAAEAADLAGRLASEEAATCRAAIEKKA